MAETLGGLSREILHRRIRLDGAGDDAEHRDPAGERIGDGLPHEDRGRRTVRGLDHDGLVRCLGRCRERPIGRRRHVADDRVEKWLHRDIRGSRGADQREDATGADAALQAFDELVLGQRSRLEELLHQRIVGFSDHLDQRVTGGLRRRLEVAGNRALRRLAAAVGRERPALHRHEIDDAAKILFFANRNLNRNHRAAEDAAQRVERPAQAGALAVEAVEHDDPRRLHFGGHAPHFLGRHLHARDRIDDDERGVRDAQRRPRVAEEIGHAGRVDEVDLGAIPLDVGEAGGEGVLAGDLFFVVVGDGGAFVDAAEAVDSAGIEQQRGEQLRLAGAAMADQRDISQALGVVDFHGRWPPKLPAYRFQLPARND